MAALAAIRNPKDSLGFLLFFCSMDQQVGLDRRKDNVEQGRSIPTDEEPELDEPRSGTPFTRETPATDDPIGVIKNPS